MTRMPLLVSAALVAVAAALAPQAALAHPSQARGEARAQTRADIVDVAQAAGGFSTLLAAAEAAGLVDTLKGPGPFTIFAPTDQAFAGLGEDAVRSLLQPQNRAELRALLAYHVVPGRIEAADLIGRTAMPRTVQGDSLRVDGRQGGVSVNAARVVRADVRAANGIIHVIDQVLLPQ